MQHNTISCRFTRTANMAFASEVVNLLSTFAVKNRVLCMKVCDEFSACPLVTYNKVTRVCNVYLSNKNDSVYDMNTDVFTKKVPQVTGYKFILCNYRSKF